jgi:chromosome segregation ATPase
MKTILVLLIAFLIGVSGVSVYRFAIAYKEQHEMKLEIQQSKEELNSLRIDREDLFSKLSKSFEKEKLLQLQNDDLAARSKQSEDKIVAFESELADKSAAIDSLRSQLTISIAQSSALAQQAQELKSRVDYAEAEKLQLTVKLSSVEELKKALRELRLKTREAVSHKPQATRITQGITTEEISEGNQGFMLRDGQLTYPAKVRIKVQPFSK